MVGKPWDVIVVGARCAGSPLAMLLARRGYRVLLVDRATFPSDTISSHQVHQTGLARLQRWGLLDDLVATGCPLFTSGTFNMRAGLITGDLIPADEIAFTCVPRRHILDTILVRAAERAGAEMREGFGLTGLTFDGDRVVGISGVGPGGDRVTERATLVVGADGRNSTVAKLVGAPKYRDDGALTIQYYSYWSGANHPDPVIYTREDWGVAVAPTHDGLLLMAMGTTRANLSRFRADIDAGYQDRIKTIPELADQVAGGRREEPFKGLAEVPNFYRQSYGPGWALAGDAGYYRDPVTAQGISDAFRDADSLADAIDRGFSGREDLSQALAGYQRDRDGVTQAAYGWTLASARFAPEKATTQAFLGQVAADPELSQMFVNLNAALSDLGALMALAAERATTPV
jgi:2-polyprenyl-6-methoxyphenol hydroxylase-like FAD-dependent oxidoreductase